MRFMANRNTRLIEHYVELSQKRWKTFIFVVQFALTNKKNQNAHFIPNKFLMPYHFTVVGYTIISFA